ncbi:lactosylceramide 4-alpha-galactosyltransferase-like [Hetaerina americana]|uniref:lactosylceramide 4-alpha-galactosyltransferase-like n=1 Tax=Hetaerina americana TaxID=62018 RepID=UPI003A7F2911
MVTRLNKYLLLPMTLFAVVTCILFAANSFFDGSGIQPWPSLHAHWDGDLCAKILGGTVNGNRVVGDMEPQGETPRDVVVEDVADGSIFFHETSCSKDLNPRQACAVESAARTNPKTQVYVLMTSPNVSIGRDGISRYARLLSLSYPNVRVNRLDLRTYSQGTPMEEWVAGGHLTASKWFMSHASDALRYLTLWRYGGTYLDLDMVLMKPLVGMRNFAGAEGNEDVAAGVINVDGPGGPGHVLADAFVREFVSDFRGYEWGHNGPGVISRVLARECNTSVGAWSGCPQGFRVYPPSAFYPIPWREWRQYFNEKGASREAMGATNQAVAAHVWNRHSVGAKVRVGSHQLYGLLAARYCPVVYRNCGKTF